MLRPIKNQVAAQDGDVSILACFLVPTFVMLGDYAVDVSGMATESVRLQIAADSAAHAALVKREVSTVPEAMARALDLVEMDLPTSYYGDVVHDEEIVFGVWDQDSRTFSVNYASGSAVRVAARRTTANDNAMRTKLWQVIGVNSMNLVAQSTSTTWIRPVSARVSFLTLSWTSNPTTPSPMASASIPTPMYRPEYLTTTVTRIISDRRIDETYLVEGALHDWNCLGGSGGTLNQAAAPIKNVVIVANCEVKFGAGTELKNVIFQHTSTSAMSFVALSGLQVGKDDGCADSGGAQLVTLGGMEFAANLTMYGGQLLAVGDVAFAARANDIEGAAIVSGSQISGTSNRDMAFCATGMDGNLTAKYFRMVEYALPITTIRQACGDIRCR